MATKCFSKEKMGHNGSNDGSDGGNIYCALTKY